MPHEFIAKISGNCHVQNIKESPFEHNPHGYNHMHTPLESEHAGIAEAVRKERKIAGLKE